MQPRRFFIIYWPSAWETHKVQFQTIGYAKGIIARITPYKYKYIIVDEHGYQYPNLDAIDPNMIDVTAKNTHWRG